MSTFYLFLLSAQLLPGDPGSVFLAACVSSGLGTVAMALYARRPYLLAPIAGLTTYFALVVALGVPADQAFGAVFLEGLIFAFLSRFVTPEMFPEELWRDLPRILGAFLLSVGLSTMNTPSLIVFAVAVLLYPFTRLSFFVAILTSLFFPPSPPVNLHPALFHPVAFPPLHVLLLFFFVDFFDSLATMISLGEKELRKPLLVDGLAAALAGLLGSSALSTLAESVICRSWISSLTAGILYLLTPLLLPQISRLPPVYPGILSAVGTVLLFKGAVPRGPELHLTALSSLVSFAIGLPWGLITYFVLLPLLRPSGTSFLLASSFLIYALLLISFGAVV